MAHFASKFVLVSATIAFAGDASAQTLGYFLPKVVVGGVVSQRIEHCPNGVGSDIYPLIITTIAVKPTYVPDDYVEINAKSGFLAQRSVEVNLRADGTLNSVNASSEGQGAEVLGAAVKVAAGVAGLSGGNVGPTSLGLGGSTNKNGRSSVAPPPPPGAPVKCRDDIADKVTSLLQLRADVAQLASDIANDRQISLRALEIAEGQKAQIADLEDALTLRVKANSFTAPANRSAVAIDKPEVHLETLSSMTYDKWFLNSDLDSLKASKILGAAGFKFSVSVNKTIFNRMRSLGVEQLPQTSKNIVYLRSIPATVSLEVANDESATAQALAAEAKFEVPQFSRYFTLPAGSGGIFGTSEAKVELSESGTPTLLSYGAKGVGADISALTDTSLTAAETIRDARTKALERAAERLKARQDVLDLIEKANEAAANDGGAGR